MPADRRIIVHVEQPGHRNDFGEYVNGPITPLAVWATKDDRTLEDILETGGDRQSVTRKWRVRYDKRIYDSLVSLLEVEDGGLTFNVESIVEVTDQGVGRQRLRRRWIDIEGVHTI